MRPVKRRISKPGPAAAKTRRPANGRTPSYELLFHNSPEPMFIFDHKTLRFLDVNDAAVKKYGYSRAEFLRMNLADIRPPEDVPKLLERVRRLKPGLQNVGRWRHRLKDGRVILVEIVTHTVRFNGRDAVLSMIQDVSGRKKLEEQLKGVQQQLRVLISNAPIILFALDRNGVITISEGQGLAAIGLKSGEHVGRSVYEIYQGHPQIPSNILRALKGEAFSSTIEVSGVVFDARYAPMRDSSGEVTGVIGVATDVTARWRAQQERDLLLSRERVARAEAEAANRAKDEFLALLSHELRTPMTAMIGWTWMLRSKPMDEENVSRALSIVERNMKVQAQIIEDLLDISSLRSGKLRLQSRIVELGPIVESAVNAAQPLAQAKAIKITADLEPSPGTVLGDPERLGQIAWNLLSNAVKFTLEKGSVHVKLRRCGGSIELAVSDTGEGISPEFLPFLFGIFRQAEPSATRKHRGLGLGLAIVWDLVELHGGTIRAFSEGVGKGSTFTVSLPVTAQKTLPASGEPQAAARGSARTPRNNIEAIPVLDNVNILIIDDEADIRETVATVLENYGAVVTAVSCASEALDAVLRLKPHVMISDIVMPVEDGYALIKKIRALGPERGGDTPAIALTGYGQAEDRTRALLAGFNIYVQKPVEPAELAAAVANLTGRTRLR